MNLVKSTELIANISQYNSMIIYIYMTVLFFPNIYIDIIYVSAYTYINDDQKFPCMVGSSDETVQTNDVAHVDASSPNQNAASSLGTLRRSMSAPLAPWTRGLDWPLRRHGRHKRSTGHPRRQSCLG